ncbi:MAG: hypothetical protein SGILL_010265 [Bacillariaceae sp.]
MIVTAVLAFLLWEAISIQVEAFAPILIGNTCCPTCTPTPTPTIPASASSSSKTTLSAILIDGYDDAFRIIDDCAMRGDTSDELYAAVRLIDKNAFKIYPDESHKQELWKTAHGSWKLQLATGGGKYTTFKPIPIFAFAYIDDTNFGNGVGINSETILLSLLGPHEFKTKRRQMIITISDMYLGSNKVARFLPDFVKNVMGIGKRPHEYTTRPPAFTFIGASPNALIARGGTGGIAIWTRLQDDISLAAYGRKDGST